MGWRISELKDAWIGGPEATLRRVQRLRLWLGAVVMGPTVCRYIKNRYRQTR